METGSIRKVLLSLFPLIIMQKPKLHVRSYLPMLTAPLPTGRTELALGEISDDDKVSLTQWMAYIRKLKALDLSEVKRRGHLHSNQVACITAVITTGWLVSPASQDFEVSTRLTRTL
ncbi:Caudovirales tail fiber assembly protein [Salmonella enterica subsp. arizonae]|nr:Caudovirales tail fiber assembly protein [Salmonella enterica subsp. arizonae]